MLLAKKNCMPYANRLIINRRFLMNVSDKIINNEIQTIIYGKHIMPIMLHRPKRKMGQYRVISHIFYISV